MHLIYISRTVEEGEEVRTVCRWRDNGIMAPLYPEDIVSVWMHFHSDNYSPEFMTGLGNRTDIGLTPIQSNDLILGHMETINHL